MWNAISRVRLLIETRRSNSWERCERRSRMRTGRSRTLWWRKTRVAVRVTFRGTQQGKFLDIPPSGKQVAMPATAFMRLAGDTLVEAWILRDRLTLMQQLGV